MQPAKIHSFSEKRNLRGLPPSSMAKQLAPVHTAAPDTIRSGRKNKSRQTASGDTSKIAIRIGKGLFEFELSSSSKLFAVGMTVLLFVGIAGLLLLAAYLRFLPELAQ